MHFSPSFPLYPLKVLPAPSGHNSSSFQAIGLMLGSIDSAYRPLSIALLVREICRVRLLMVEKGPLSTATQSGPTPRPYHSSTNYS